MAKKKSSKVKKTQNLVAKFAHLYNTCKCIDTNDKKYNRKQKHKNKEVYSGVAIA